MTSEITSGAEIAPSLVWLVLLGGFALLGSALAAGMHAQRRRVPVSLIVLGPAFAALSVWYGAQSALGDWATLDATAKVTAVSGFGAAYLLGAVAAAPSFLITGVLMAWVGAGDQPPRWVPAGIAFLAGALAAGLVIGGGYQINWIYAVVRGVSYLAAGSMVAVAWLASQTGGRIAAAAAAALLPMWIAIGEASELGLAQLLLVQQTEQLHPTQWEEGVFWMLRWLDLESQAGFTALGIASGLAIAGAVMVRRIEAGVAAVAAIVISWGLLLGADIGAERLIELGPACTGPLVEAEAEADDTDTDADEAPAEGE